MADKMTPRLIIANLLNRRISEDEAVKQINCLIEEVRDELTGTMGATEYKYFIDSIKEIYKDYGYQIKGSMDNIKEILDAVIKKCGFGAFEDIKNTKENRRKIEKELTFNKNHYFG